MHIRQKQLFHGAALIQIAEHLKFTAINLFGDSRNAFRINDNIGVFLKYATSPDRSTLDYLFNFSEDNLNELAIVNTKCGHLYVVMICVEAEAICCITYDQLVSLINARKTAKGQPEKTYSVLAKAPKGRSFRVNVNKPGRKGFYLPRTEIIVSRNQFPELIFS